VSGRTGVYEDVGVGEKVCVEIVFGVLRALGGTYTPHVACEGARVCRTTCVWEIRCVVR